MNILTVKKDFPIFKRKINKKPIVYLDSTASSLKPSSVIKAINDYYTKYSVNIFRGVYTLSEEATRYYEEARAAIADFIHAKNPNEIIFVRNATEAINLVASTWGEANINSGDTIMTTVMEHHANFVTWQELAIKKNARLSIIDVDDDGYLKLDEIYNRIDKKTKLLALTYISNVLGTINPIKEIVKKVKHLNPNIKILVDCAAASPHIPLDVQDLGCDFIAFSGHKMLGPTGIGVVWGKYEILETMPAYQYGGDMISEVYLDHSVYKNPPHKFEAGTPHIAGGIGLGAAVSYLKKIGMKNIRAHEEKLAAYALRELAKIKGLKVYGPTKREDKSGIMSFTLKGIHPHDLAQILNDDNICVRSGHHCAMPLHTRYGLAATTRASFYIYNDKGDVDSLVQGILKAKELFKI